MSNSDRPASWSPPETGPLNRDLLNRIVPFVRPGCEAWQLESAFAPLPFDPAFAVGLHMHAGRRAGLLTVGDAKNDTGIGLALLAAIAEEIRNGEARR